MADFAYLVIDKTGKEKKGNIEAANPEEATSRLKKEGYVVLKVEKTNALTKEIDFSIGQKVKPRDLSVFCRQFVSMISAGVTILDSLSMLSEQTENKSMAKAISGVRDEIAKGETLSSAMARYPKVFPSIMVSMVAAGEASGKLEVSLNRIALMFEKQAKLNGIVKKAAVYPIIVVIVAIAVVAVMLVKVIPAYKDMFDQFGAELPMITKIMIGLSNFIITKWYVIILVVVAAVVGIRAYKKTVSGQILFGTLARKLPIFGKLNVKTAASNFARTLSTLVYSGMPLIEALNITANTMTNYLYKEAVQNAKEQVAKGVPLSEPIKECGLFPPMVGHMTAIGEETGDLEGMLNRLADYYDEEVDMATQTVLAAMEPMIILVLAVIVICLVAAIMMPMLQMYSVVDSL